MVTKLLRKNAKDSLWKHGVIWTGMCFIIWPELTSFIEPSSSKHFHRWNDVWIRSGSRNQTGILDYGPRRQALFSPEFWNDSTTHFDKRTTFWYLTFDMKNQKNLVEHKSLPRSTEVNWGLNHIFKKLSVEKVHFPKKMMLFGAFGSCLKEPYWEFIEMGSKLNSKV